MVKTAICLIKICVKEHENVLWIFSRSICILILCCIHYMFIVGWQNVFQQRQDHTRIITGIGMWKSFWCKLKVLNILSTDFNWFAEERPILVLDIHSLNELYSAMFCVFCGVGPKRLYVGKSESIENVFFFKMQFYLILYSRISFPHNHTYFQCTLSTGPQVPTCTVSSTANTTKSGITYSATFWLLFFR